MFYSDRQLPACFGNSSLSWILWPSTARAPNDVERSGARVRGCGQRAVRDVGPGGVESIACPTGFALLGCAVGGLVTFGLAWLGSLSIASRRCSRGSLRAGRLLVWLLWNGTGGRNWCCFRCSSVLLVVAPLHPFVERQETEETEIQASSSLGESAEKGREGGQGVARGRESQTIKHTRERKT